MLQASSKPDRVIFPILKFHASQLLVDAREGGDAVVVHVLEYLRPQLVRQLRILVLLLLFLLLLDLLDACFDQIFRSAVLCVDVARAVRC